MSAQLKAATIGPITRFSRPYDWPAIDFETHEAGVAILEGVLDRDELHSLNKEIDQNLASGRDIGKPKSGVDGYDLFLGHKTLRIHGLAAKVHASRALIADPGLVGWAERSIARIAQSVLLNAAELIQIQPGEGEQMLHRDTDSWPVLPLGETPALVNALIALDDFTLDNGATFVAPGSWRWERSREPRPDEMLRAEMNAGDAVIFRGDLVHNGGANNTARRRRALSISYCAGWLRPVENSILNVPPKIAAGLEPKLQALLGYSAHDASDQLGGLVGLYDGGDPARVLREVRD